MEKSHEEKVLEDIRSIDPMEFHEPEGRGFPVSWIAIIIIIMFILWYVPSYAIKEDPRPMHVDKIDFALTDIPKRLNTIDEVHLLDVSPAVRNAAIQIGTRACDGNQICYAKAFHNYVRDNIIYMPDPPTEYIQSPEETLLGAGDCEDQAILLFMLMQSIGIRARIVLIPDHAYLQIYLPDARAKYRDKEGWVNLDPTCTYCEFGDIPSFGSRTILRYV